MIYVSVALGALVGWVLWRTVGWCIVEEPMADRWRRLLESADDPGMPPRRHRARFP